MDWKDEFPCLSLSSGNQELVAGFKEKLVASGHFSLVAEGSLLTRHVLVVRVVPDQFTLDLPRQVYVDLAASSKVLVEEVGDGLEVFASYPSQNLTEGEIHALRANPMTEWFWDPRYVGSLHMPPEGSIHLVSSLLERKRAGDRCRWSFRRAVDVVDLQHVPEVWVRDLQAAVKAMPETLQEATG